MANFFDQFDTAKSGGNFFDQFDHKESLASDLGKSAASGLESGTIGLLGMAGDARQGLSAATDWAGGKMGLSPDTIQTVKDYAGKAANMAGPVGIGLANAPSSADISKSVTDPVVDPNYQPQSKLGEYAKTTAQFAPGALLGGEGGVGRQLLTQVLGPAVVSETAGQLTKGTAAEPYARIAGAGFGGLGASMAAEKNASSAALKAATPTKDEVKAAATSTYDNLNARNTALPLPQATLDRLADDITTSLNKSAIRPSTADKIHAAVDEIRSPATNGAPDVADLVSARENIKSLLSSPDRNKAGAAVALPKIEQAIEQASPGTMQDIRTADKNYAAFKANEALDKRLARADLRASGEHSGLNLGNRIRQNVTNYLLSNEARYLSPENKASLEQVVHGSPAQNLVRFGSNVLGGGGGLGSAMLGIGGAAAGQYSGHPELSLLPLGGFGLRKLSNNMVSKAAERAAAEIRSRAPLGQGRRAAQPAPLPSKAIRNAVIASLLAGASQQPNILNAYNRNSNQ